MYGGLGADEAGSARSVPTEVEVDPRARETDDSHLDAGTESDDADSSSGEEDGGEEDA